MNFDFLQMILAPKRRYRAFAALAGAYAETLEPTFYAIRRNWDDMARFTFSEQSVECAPVHMPNTHLSGSAEHHFVDHEGWNWFAVFEHDSNRFNLMREDFMLPGERPGTFICVNKYALSEHFCICALNDGSSAIMILDDHAKVQAALVDMRSRKVSELEWNTTMTLFKNPRCVQIDERTILVMHCGASSDDFATMERGSRLMRHRSCFRHFDRSPDGVVGIGDGRALFSVLSNHRYRGTWLALWDMALPSNLDFRLIYPYTVSCQKIVALDIHRVLIYGGHYSDSTTYHIYNTKYYIYDHANKSGLIIDGAPIDLDMYTFYKPRERWRLRERSFMCSACGMRATAMKMCTQCKGAYYCNHECQRAHWKEHKLKCKK